MAKFRVMEIGKPVPPWTESGFVATNVDYTTGDHTFTIGNLSGRFSKNESVRIIESWNKIERLNDEWRAKGISDEEARMQFMAEQMASHDP